MFKMLDTASYTLIMFCVEDQFLFSGLKEMFTSFQFKVVKCACSLMEEQKTKTKQNKNKKPCVLKSGENIILKNKTLYLFLQTN